LKNKGQKEKLKPISFYGLDTTDVIRAIMRVSPERLKELEEGYKRLLESEEEFTSSFKLWE
jgi:hypothetical protein